MSKSLYGREILDVGDWPASTGDITVAGSAIDALISSFDALSLSGRVPLKFGHGETEQYQPFREGLPALGWVSRLYRKGSKLLADFTDIPDIVFEAIQKGLYKFVSVELLRDVQAGTRKLPWVLNAVALLGADQPAVGTLKDLQALLRARKPVFRARERMALRRVSFSNQSEARKGMEKHEVDALVEAALKKQGDTLRAEFTTQIEKVKADAKAEADAQVAKAKAESHRSQIKAKFEAAVKAEALLPAKRESFYKFNRVDDDSLVMEIKLEDVDAYIAEFGDKAKLSAKPTTKSGERDEEEGMQPDQIVVHRAKKLCYSRQKDPTKDAEYQAAVVEVLKSDKDLAKKYANLAA